LAKKKNKKQKRTGILRVKYYSFGRVRKARMIAADKHAGQFRKERISNKRLPFICHTSGTAEYLMAMRMPEDLVIAGHLHDVLEDTDMTEKEIEELFGPHVLFLVKAVTEPKGKPWPERKKFKINALANGTLEVKLLGTSDHCDNLLSILEALYNEGLSTPAEFAKAKVWHNFTKGYESQKWYHQESCKAVFANVPYDMLHPMFGKLMRLVEIIFGEQVIIDPHARIKVRRRQRDWINPYNPETVNKN